MIAAWMVYFVCVAAILTLGAHLAERALHERRMPTRAAWIGSMVLSVALPIFIASLATATDRQPTLESLGLVEFPKASLTKETPIVWVAGHTRDQPARRTVDDWLAWSWLLASAMLAGVAAFACVSMQRRLRLARTAAICGAAVTILDDTGPAVAGFIRPRIVIPEWLLRIDSNEQSLIVAHEREHLQARDAQLLGCAWLLLILMPWNLPLWWQARRLRQAMEIDCDARVLAKGLDRSKYGSVLLAVAERDREARSFQGALLMSTSFLEKRMLAMFTGPHRYSRALTLVMTAGAAALLVTATGIAAPEGPALFRIAATASEIPRLPSPAADVATDRQELVKAIQHYQPRVGALNNAMRGDVWVVVDGDGALVNSALDINLRGVGSPSRDLAAEFSRRFGVQPDNDAPYFVIEFAPGEAAPGIVNLMVTVRDGPAADLSGPHFPIAPDSGQSAASKLAATAAAQLALITHFDGAAVNKGLPPGQEMWFLFDASGVALAAGRRTTLVDADKARADLVARYPTIKVGYVSRGTPVKGPDGKRLPVSWHWLEKGSPVPTTLARI